MTAGAWITLAAIAVGLPVLAWFIGGRRFWTTIRGRVPRNPQAEITRRYELSPAEVHRVRSALKHGQGLDEPRLRAATTDWAHEVLTAWARSRRARRIGLWFIGVGAAFVTVGAVLNVVAGNGISWTTWVLLGVFCLQVGIHRWMWPRILRNLERAVVLNSGSVP